uniref:Uncharacterized protein n=1 Tax=Melopsittacus undulatus TaxID=13146 RepID=A0A8V5GQ08_MELUD
MQEPNAFLLSALQPEAGVCSLALPSDRQLDGRSRETAEGQRLRSARVQEQVRIRMIGKGLRGPIAGSFCPTADSFRPTAGSFHPIAGSFRPTAGSFHPIAGSICPTAGSFHPIADSFRPTADSFRPIAGSISAWQPSATGAWPRAAATATPCPRCPTAPHDPAPSTSAATARGHNLDTLSLRSLRLTEGPPHTAADDRYSLLSEQMDSVGQPPSALPRGAAQPHHPRASAMRTLQRFQSNNRSRLSTGSFGTVPTGAGSYLGMMEHGSRAPSVRSLAEGSHHLQDQRMDMYNGHNTLLSHQSGDPNLQVLGAAYLQHKCYSDSNAKKQVSTYGCVKLFNSPNQEVQRHATGAMRNLIYDNTENKLALVEENGIYELMRTLREPDDELRKNVTGILWNLSSSDNLKDRLARDNPGTSSRTWCWSPLSGLGGSGVIQQNPSEAEIFYNSTGFLRNLSSASQQTRQKMRECHGLVDSMIHYVNSSLEVGKSEDKSVEKRGVVSCATSPYRLYDEMPPSSLQRLEGHRPMRDAVGDTGPTASSPQHYLNADIVTFTEVSKDPKGMEWLWNPQIVGIYNRLLQRCELNKHTTEAASGALQNITAGDRRWAGVLSRLALEQERILNPVLDRVRTADQHQLRSLTGLIRNLSRHARNKDEMSTKVVSHLMEKLPGSAGDKAPPVDVVVNIIAVLNNLVVESPMAARDIVYFDGLRKLFYIKKRRDSSDNEKSSRAASSLLGNMWQYNKLHRDFKMKGYRKEDFLSL